MPQDNLREKKQTVQERMRQSIISRAGEGIAAGASEAASEMIKNKLQEKSALKTLTQTALIGAKVGAKIKRPDTPLAPTPEPKRY
jgi:hypothetical protein